MRRRTGNLVLDGIGVALGIAGLVVGFMKQGQEEKELETKIKSIACDTYVDMKKADKTVAAEVDIKKKEEEIKEANEKKGKS